MTQDESQEPVLPIPPVADDAPIFLGGTEGQPEPERKPLTEPPPDTFYSPAGERFDPALHVSKDSITKGGKFRLKKGATKIVAETPQLSQSDIQNRKMLANFATQQYYFVGQMFTPTFTGNAEEKQYISGLFDRYFESKGMIDLPPGIALALGLTTIAVSKFSVAPPESNFQKIMRKVKMSGLKSLFKRNTKPCPTPLSSESPEAEKQPSQE